jgi:hypothetical protein
MTLHSIVPKLVKNVNVCSPLEKEHWTGTVVLLQRYEFFCSVNQNMPTFFSFSLVHP